MSGNIVKLIFESISRGTGFSTVAKQTKEAVLNAGMAKGAFEKFGMMIGGTANTIGRLTGALIQGNVWGLAAEGAKYLCDKLGLFKDRTAEAKEKFDKLEESTRKFYETVNTNAQKSIEKIDAERHRAMGEYVRARNAIRKRSAEEVKGGKDGEDGE